MALTQPTSVRLKSDVLRVLKNKQRQSGESLQQTIAEAIRKGLNISAEKKGSK
jgi:hypothetical protein